MPGHSHWKNSRGSTAMPPFEGLVVGIALWGWNILCLAFGIWLVFKMLKVCRTIDDIQRIVVDLQSQFKEQKRELDELKRNKS